MRMLLGIIAAILIVSGIWTVEIHTRNLQYLYGMLEVTLGLTIAHVAWKFRQFQNPNWRKRWFASIKGYPNG